MSTEVKTNEPAVKKSPRERIAVVRSNKMDKTVVVELRRQHRHTKYLKAMGERVRFKAHDAENTCKIGDTVLLVETRPMSKGKRWRVAKVLKQALEIAGPVPGAAETEA